MSAPEFFHRFVPGKTARTLLLFHGTGGDEEDLLPLGRALDPDAALLSPRGQVIENGMPRFFRRLAEGVFDEEDVIRRADELAQFIRNFGESNHVDPAAMTAVGYSNGANIAAAMMLLGVAPFGGAVLLRPMVPLLPNGRANLSDNRTLLIGGRMDPIATADEVSGLAELLRASGAAVDVRFADGGHGLTQFDLATAREWLNADAWSG